jgi:hypothetical protein
MSYQRDTLLKDLHEHVIEIMFTKVDGTERIMRCTLREDLLPKNYEKDPGEVKKFHKENKDIIAAWDMQKGGWRSFRIDSVQYCEIKDNY